MKKLTILFIAMMFTAGMAFAQSNDATIDQVGDDHEATITQTGAMNSAFVEQTADAGREGSDVGTATVTQSGDDNVASVRQRNFFGSNEATISQVGSGNIVEGNSAGSSFYQNHGLNILDVAMEGDNNRLYTFAAEAQKNVNTFLLDIYGSDNLVGMFQEFGFADIEITGEDNEVNVYQRGKANATEAIALIDIEGSGNFADVYQNGKSNSATVDILGDGNSAEIYQLGDSNTGTITQSGNSNTATVSQSN